jgi:putative protease
MGGVIITTEKIGYVTHFFNHINVAVLQIINGELKIGDTIHFVGAHTDFTQKVESMEIDKKPIKTAKPGDDIGIKVNDRVREHDVVYKEK